MNVSSSVVRAQSILFLSLAITLFVAFITVLGKQWILHYQRTSVWASIADRGKERQLKFVGLRKWGLHFIIPLSLQLALLLFSVGIIVYLWNLDLSAAKVMMSVTGIGFVFYIVITVVAMVRTDFLFQTSLSISLLKVFSWMKKIIAHVRAWLSRRPAVPPLQPQVPGSMSSFKHFCKTLFSTGATPGQDNENGHMRLSNPMFWRRSPLFLNPLPEDTAASAGFWLLENSTDFSATAVAAVFPHFQWQPHHHSITALTRLHDTYKQCFRAHRFDEPARLKALESAAAYYILYHARVIWIASKSRQLEVEILPPNLPSDLLLLHKDSDEWDRCDLFEYLLQVGHRSEPVESEKFLSYIAPYWFCGNSDSAVKFRSSRLDSLDKLIDVLALAKLDPATLTNCVLCAGAAADFPLHPKDLIRVDKRYDPLFGTSKAVLIGTSDYLSLTFQKVVEHVCGIISPAGRHSPRAARALQFLLNLAKHTTPPPFDVQWVNGRLSHAAESNMEDREFKLLLQLRARPMEEDATFNMGLVITSSTAHTPDDTLFSKIMNIIQIYANDGSPSLSPNDGLPSPFPNDGSPLPPPNDGLPLPPPNDGSPSSSPNDGLPSPFPNDSLPLPFPNDGLPLPFPNDGLPSPPPNDGSPAPSPNDGLPSPSPNDGLPSPSPDEIFYGGLVAIKGIQQLDPALLDETVLQTLLKVMGPEKPQYIRRAAYDVMLITRDQWLRSDVLHQNLEALDPFRRLCDVVKVMARPDYKKSFLMMMKILSEDVNRHSYVRNAMGIWLDLRDAGREDTLHILKNVGNLQFLAWDSRTSPFDEFLQTGVVREWENIPGRPNVRNLTADQLHPLMEVTKQFVRSFGDIYRTRVLLTINESVVPALDRQLNGSSEVFRGIVDDFLT